MLKPRICSSQLLQILGSNLSDFIEDKKVASPGDTAVNINLQEQIKMGLGTLTRREERVLRMRFGIGGIADHTLE